MKRFVSMREWHLLVLVWFSVGIGFIIGMTENLLPQVIVTAIILGAFGIIWRELTNRDKELMEKNGFPKHFWWDWR